ncbi:MAG: restriction endonuclease subunit S [Clostridia bacterium]|nr:restriction endonuclease subunit S [Clostridia bacterium]
MKKVKLGDLTNAMLNVPSIEEQKKIADRLDKVVGLIEKLNEQLAKLDQLVKSRFISQEVA